MPGGVVGWMRFNVETDGTRGRKISFVDLHFFLSAGRRTLASAENEETGGEESGRQESEHGERLSKAPERSSSVVWTGTGE